jgi:precorrin-2 dehydrogenase/sirohydrochlorin ferrochelatase
MAAHHYVACLDLRGRRCLVVGAGAVADEKARGLEAAGARVAKLARYARGDAGGHWLVIAAAVDREVNRLVRSDCDALGVFCNVADDPELCSFILPAIHREGTIAVAVSTGGASPALAQRLRAEIARLVTPRHAELAEELRALRPWAKEHLPTYEARRDFFAARVEEALS